MDITFLLHEAASRQLQDLPLEVDERIRNKLREMTTNEFRELTDYDVRPVVGTNYDIYRTRIGGYRVFFLYERPFETEVIAAILHVDKREGAYGNLERLVNRAKDFFE